MPRPIKSARAKPGSDSPANSPPKAAPLSPQFTKSKQSSPPSGPDQPENCPDSAERLSPEELSLDRTEPFPPGLFRVPVPNAVFDQMPEMRDSALRCLLALLHLSFRFDPAESEWVHKGDWFSRLDIEEQCGLSSQGVRNGLAELRCLGWAEVDQAGQSHQHRLLLKVPSQRFTYVPTALLESASEIGSGAALRVVLAVLRQTWGWTQEETDPQSGQSRAVHDRWAQLSNRELARATGRSETAVAQAAKALQGEWIERVRPGNGRYQYRFLPEAIRETSGDSPGNGSAGESSSCEKSSCEESANDLAPDRQKSGTPSSYKESLPRDKQIRPQQKEQPRPETRTSGSGTDALPAGNSPNSGADPSGRDSPTEQARPKSDSPNPDFSDLPPEKRQLAEKLANVGVWAGRIAELLSRFSPERIRTNFQLYRRRDAQQTIRKPGAWLYGAITEGYALPGKSSISSGGARSGPGGSLPPLEHKETVSEAKKDAYVAQGGSEEHFHRCPSGRSGPEERRFMYFDPEEGGPERRV